MEREEGKKAKEESKSVGELIMMGEKLKLGALVLGKREGKSTPSPPWKLGLVQADGTLVEDFDYSIYSKSLSARKLGANLWENEPQLNIMSKNRVADHHRRHRRRRQENNLGVVTEESPADINNHTHQPLTASNIAKKQLGKVKQVHEPAHQSSAPSYCSSSEMAHHRHAMTPNSSFDSKAKLIESSHGLKTSTELLKLLNRIWSLEEKNTLNMSLVRKLKKELNKSQTQVRELLLEKKGDKKEIESLVKQLTEYKVARNKEQERVRDVLKLMEEKLSDESKVRKNLENRHQKLTQEISEMKSSFEGEMHARAMLEDLCDEFAKGIKGYEKELRFLRQKFSVKDDEIVRESDDHLILHMSEAWLDERSHTKLRDTANHGNGPSDKKTSTVENLYPEIKAFLRSKQSADDDDGKKIHSQKPFEGGNEIPMQSLESLNMNEPASAPWKGNDEEEDEEDHVSNSNCNNNDNKNCLQLCSGMGSKQANGFKHQEETPKHVKPTRKNKKLHARKVDGAKSRIENLNEAGTSKMESGVDLEETTSRKASLQRENVLEGSFDPSSFVGPTSPVEKWTSSVTSATADHDIREEAPLTRHQSLKSNTLRAKLIEARLESQRSRAKSSKSPLQD